jgi:hypothetical protein
MANKAVLVQAGDGTAIPENMVGGSVSAEATVTPSLSAVSGVVSIPITIGKWLISYNLVIKKNTSNAGNASIIVSDVSASSNSLTGYSARLSDRGQTLTGNLSMTTSFVYTATSNKTIYGNVYLDGSTGAASAEGVLIAIRIA